MEDTSEQLSQTIGLLYETILRPEVWMAALESLCDYVGGVSANLFWQDPGQGGIQIFHTVGENLDYTRSYVETYRHMNPYFPAASFYPLGQVMTGADLLPHDKFAQTRFYKEWVRPQGLVDMLAANVSRAETGAAFLSVRRGEAQGFADEGAVRRMRLLVPHVRRAVLISEAFDGAERRGEALEDLLETISAGVFLLDPSAKLVRANRQAERLLDRGAIVYAADGRLQAVDPRARRDLAEAIRRAASGGDALGGHGVAVALDPQGDGDWFAHVLPLDASALRRTRRNSASVAVFARQARLDVEPPLAIVSRLHSLTPGEVRVLAAVVELGGGVSDVAAALGLTVSTVRSHLRGLFAKTGTTRQADLVRLVAAHQTTVAAAQ